MRTAPKTPLRLTETHKLQRSTPEQIEYFFKHSPMRQEADFTELLELLHLIQQGKHGADISASLVFRIQMDLILRNAIRAMDDSDLKRFGVIRLPNP